MVENRPGGDGFVAINAFVSARDDHMLLFGPASSFTAHPYLHDKLPYDPRDLAPVARVCATLITLGVPPHARRQLARRSCSRWRARSPAS